MLDSIKGYGSSSAIIDSEKFVLVSTPGFLISQKDISGLFALFETNNVEPYFGFKFQMEDYVITKSNSELIIGTNSSSDLVLRKLKSFMILVYLEKRRSCVDETLKKIDNLVEMNKL